MYSLQNILFSFNISPKKTTKKNNSNSNQKSVKKYLSGGSARIDNEVVFTEKEKKELTHLLNTYKNGN